MSEDDLREIPTKAYLSCKNLQEYFVPDSMEKIGDWAFAHATELREISFPAKDIVFGKKVFLGCSGLKRVVVRPASSSYAPGIWELLSTWLIFLGEQSIPLVQLGTESGQRKWLADYDERFWQFLIAADDVDFEAAFIGWFDVTDVDDQRVAFIKKRRQEKAELIFQRLYRDCELSEDMKQRFANRLRRDLKEGAETFFKSSGEVRCNPAFVQIWKEIGGLELFDKATLLQWMPDADAEVKACLLKEEGTEGEISSESSAEYLKQLLL